MRSSGLRCRPLRRASDGLSNGHLAGTGQQHRFAPSSGQTFDSRIDEGSQKGGQQAGSVLSPFVSHPLASGHVSIAPPRGRLKCLWLQRDTARRSRARAAFFAATDSAHQRGDRGVSDPPLGSRSWPHPLIGGSLTPRLSMSSSAVTVDLQVGMQVGSIFPHDLDWADIGRRQ